MSSAEESLDESEWVGKFSAEVDRKVRAEGERLRAEFVATAQLRPPDVLRLIDIQATCQAGQVTLRGYKEVLQLPRADNHVSSSSNLSVDYSAISHTFGMDVYSIFDCECASILSRTANVPPRSRPDKPCPHFTGKDESNDRRNQVVNDILEMCHILSRAGVRYAWHDGICIAQYNEEELTATIKSIGWVYSAAKETIIFLHYVGKPMAPIAPRGCGYDLACRWHTRVWTFQEAALSKSRRYCIRVCKRSLHFKQLSGSCGTLIKEFEKKAKRFEQKASQWYDKSTSEIDVITEERFLEIIYEALEPLDDLWSAVRTFKAMLEEVRMRSETVSEQLAACVDSWYLCIQTWFECLEDLRDTLNCTCLRFPELGAALVQCSRRDSKHVGDRINSVLTLAGLKDLVAPKDFKKGGDSMEAWTIKFFEQQGQRGLAWAVLSGNEGLAESEDLDKITHSWVPLLWKPLSGPQVGGYECHESWGIQFRVCEDDRKLELTGELLCVAVTLTLKLKEDDDDPYIQDLYEKAHGKGGQALDHFTDAQQLDEGERHNHITGSEADEDTGVRLANKSRSARGEGSNLIQRLWWMCTHVFTVLFKHIFKDLFTHLFVRLPGIRGSHVCRYPKIYQIHADADKDNGEVNTDTERDKDSGQRHDHSSGDERSIDTDWHDNEDEGNGDHKEEGDEYQADAEELLDEETGMEHAVDEEMLNNKRPKIGASIPAGANRGAEIGAGSDEEKQGMAMDIVSIYTDGSHDFAVRLPEADPLDILGMATFFPLQALEDGRVIGGQHIKEGESLHAYLVAPLHYDWIISSVQPGFLFMNHVIHDHHDNNTHTYTASKIGILKARKTKAHDLLRFGHLPFKTINKLIIN